jgi:hypothetical protein
LERKPVNSSNLASVGYDPVTTILEVEFKNSNVYRYFDVSSTVYRELMSAPSIGQFFNKYIRNKYRFEEI